MSEGRTCTKCLTWKDKKEFRKSADTSKFVNKIFPQCLQCEREYNNKRYKKVEKKEKINDLTGRVCTRCKTYKLAEFFRLSQNKKSLCSYCRECENLKNRMHQAKLRGKTVNEMGYIKKNINAEYVVNRELYCELIVSKAQGRLTRGAVKMFQLIVKNMIRKFSYTNGDDKFDCMQEAYYQMFKNWHNYNELQTENAFAYMSEVCKRAMAKAFNDLNKVNGKYEKHISLSSANDGEGVFNI